MKPTNALEELRSHTVPTSRQEETLRQAQEARPVRRASRRRTWLIAGATATVGAALAFAPRVSRDHGIAWAQVVANSTDGVTITTTVFRPGYESGGSPMWTKLQDGKRSFGSTSMSFRYSEHYFTVLRGGRAWKVSSKLKPGDDPWHPTTVPALNKLHVEEVSRSTTTWQGKPALLIRLKDTNGSGRTEAIVDEVTQRIVRLTSWPYGSSSYRFVDDYAYGRIPDSEFAPPDGAIDCDDLIARIRSLAQAAQQAGDQSQPFILKTDSMLSISRTDPKGAVFQMVWGGAAPNADDLHHVRYHNVHLKQFYSGGFEMTSKECVQQNPPAFRLAGQSCLVSGAVPIEVDADIPVFKVDRSQPIKVSGVIKGYRSAFVRYRRVKNIPVLDCGDTVIREMALDSR